MAPRVTAVRPAWAIEGGRILIEGAEFPVDRPRLPDVQIGGVAARVVHASPSALSVIVPSGLDGGPTPIRVDGVAGGTQFGADRDGTICRVDQAGKAEAIGALPQSSEAFNLAIAPAGAVWVTAPTLSTYDPIYKVMPDGTVATVDVKLGRPQGIAFD